MSATRSPLQRRVAWAALLYFASGLPFGIVQYLVPVYYRQRGLDLPAIGLLNAVGLAWVLKFLWAPLIDRFGPRRFWMAGALAGMGMIIAIIGARPEFTLLSVFVLLAAFAMLSATYDVAADAYAVESFEERELGPVNGTRVMAYRVALIISGGILIGLAGQIGWTIALALIGLILILLAAAALGAPSTPRAAREHAPLWSPLTALLRVPGIWAVLLFAVTFKLGDYAMAPMVQPFWVDRGFSLAEIGYAFGTLGVAATVAGALAGGLITARIGTFRALWSLGALQALSNLGYWWAARPGTPREAVYGAAITEQFTAGLASAAFLTFLMSICEPGRAATQFALLSALFGLGRVVAGTQSGIWAERLGYERYFLVTFLIALPAYALLPLIARVRREKVALVSE